MSSLKKKILIGCASVTGAGLILLLGLFIKIKFNPVELNNEKQIIKTYDISDDYSDIYIETKDADVRFVVSENGKTSVTCINGTKKDVVGSFNKCLKVISEKKKKAGTVFNPVFDFRKDNAADITVSLPYKRLGDVALITENGRIEADDFFLSDTVNSSLVTKNGEIIYCMNTTGNCFIENENGNITVRSLQCDYVDVKNKSGEISLTGSDIKGALNIKNGSGEFNAENVECENLTAESDSGDLYLKNFLSRVAVTVKENSGNVKIRKSDANAFIIDSKSGDVDAEFVSPKIYTVESKSGSVNIPESLSGGMCKINTDSGDIRVRIGKAKNTDN